jgi:hypothetical protein
MKTNRSLLTLTFAAGLLACGDEANSTGSMVDEDYDDVAQSVAGLALEEGGDEEAALDAAELALGRAGARFRSDAEGEKTCDRGELRYRYRIECRNARGQVIEPCDFRTRTASVAVRIEGELDTPRRQGELLRQGRWSLAYDGADIVEIDGGVMSDVDTSFEALRRQERRRYMMQAQARFRDVEVDVAQQRIVGGRIEYRLEAERTRTTRSRDVEASYEVEAVVEFGPNGVTRVTVDRDREYEVDRTTGRVRRAE